MQLSGPSVCQGSCFGFKVNLRELENIQQNSYFLPNYFKLNLSIKINLCRQWSETVLSSGKFWSWAQLSVDLNEHPEQADDLLQSRMIVLVPRIYITGNTSLETSWPELP